MEKIEHKIVPHLWFDKEAREAAEYYTSIFKNSRIRSSVTLEDTPSAIPLRSIVAVELYLYVQLKLESLLFQPG